MCTSRDFLIFHPKNAFLDEKIKKYLDINLFAVTPYKLEINVDILSSNKIFLFKRYLSSK